MPFVPRAGRTVYVSDGGRVTTAVIQAEVPSSPPPVLDIGTDAADALELRFGGGGGGRSVAQVAKRSYRSQDGWFRNLGDVVGGSPPSP